MLRPTSPGAVRRGSRLIDNSAACIILNHMVNYNPQYLDDVFHALADPTRREMLRRLSEGERSVSELAAPCDMSLAGASKHIKVLERAGLVERRISGRTHRVNLRPAVLADAHAWLGFYEQFWAERLDALEVAMKAGEPDEGGDDDH